MVIKDFCELYYTNPLVTKLADWDFGTSKRLSINGLSGSSKFIALSRLFKTQNRTMLIVLDNADLAGYAYSDFLRFINKEQLAFFPHYYKKLYKQGATESANEILRTDALNKISSKKPCVIVTYPEALIEKVVSPNSFLNSKIKVVKGEKLEHHFFAETLAEFGFEEVDFVYEPGQFSVRGSIVDVFSFANEQPFRIDFFGDTVESIRIFDIERQLSIDFVEQINVVPCLQNSEEQKVAIFEFLPSDSIVALNDINYVRERIDHIYTESLIKANEQRSTPDLFQLIFDGEALINTLEGFSSIEFLRNYYRATSIDFSTKAQPNFDKNFDLVSDNIKHYLSNGYAIYIASDSKKQIDRIRSIFADRGDNIEFIGVENTLHEGFVDNDIKINFLTDHQIFGRFHKYSLKSDVVRRGKAAILLKELNQLKQGDFVVHYDYGIGQFGGLLKTDVKGKEQEVIKLIYKGNDIVFVSINSLHKISKYRGKEGQNPQLSKLGTGAWQRLKERTKSKVKDIARDLIKLYAERMETEGFSFSPDSYLQTELEASFAYEDTPDQLKVSQDIKLNMEKSKPMDMLVCGDVGFGKTEIAIRAAFKAVADSKQVAVLVPTTVLAFQHYKTFSQRLKNFPCKIEYLSRAKSQKQTKEILENLRLGKIDIIIGTHKIVSKNIVFSDLGLLVIDEEQKFGVALKERLKSVKVNVDTLTLTATPIPRTLQFSLMGARDLAILNTPPPNRYPIVTELIKYDEEIIGEAIKSEIDRNGQIFFVHNRVQSIYLMEKKLKNLVPEARIAVVHGQMPTSQLEDTIIDFIDYEYDILLATTVIESGIDMPNVNTIFIDKANSFGLSDLHQLRGRVGRGNRKAYCYLIAPDFKDITDEARRRLQAISTFSELGSGFNIAMQDMDIRGAGNMLGAEQSGFIAELGYETYQNVLNEAVREIKEEEFSDIFEEQQSIDTQKFVSDCMFETDMEIMFPSDYVSNVSERIALYRELDSITNNSDLQMFKDRLQDRFGAIPRQGFDLIQVLPLRWKAMEFGVERLVLKNDKLTMNLVSRSDSPYYSSEQFGALLSSMAKNQENSKIGMNNGKRFISINKIADIQQALDFFEELTLQPTN